MQDETATAQIDKIIKQNAGWKGDMIKDLRSIILDAGSDIVEEIKWKMPTRPEGLPVWSHKGIVCFIEIWKDNIKLIFFHGAQLKDANKLFNSRLKSSTLRAIEFHEGDKIDLAGTKKLVAEAVAFNDKSNHG